MDERCAACGVTSWVVSHETLREPDRIGASCRFAPGPPARNIAWTCTNLRISRKRRVCHRVGRGIPWMRSERRRAREKPRLLSHTGPLRCGPHRPVGARRRLPQSSELRELCARTQRGGACMSNRPPCSSPLFPTRMCRASSMCSCRRFCKSSSRRPRATVRCRGELADLVRAKLGELGRDEGDVLSVFEDVASALDWATASGLELVAAGTITLAGEVAGLLRR